MVHFRPQQWINNYAIDSDPQGNSTWPITAAETRVLFEHGDLDALVDSRDMRIPDWVRQHCGPFDVSLECTGCGNLYGHRDLREADFAAHDTCCGTGVCPPSPGAGQDYTLEIRVDVRALNDDHIRQVGADIAGRNGGRLTAIFDADWNEV